MTTVDLDDAQARHRDLLEELDPGDRLILVKDGEELATLTKSRPKRWPCKAGSAKDTAHWMAPDFDATPAEFRDYMG